MRFAVSLIAYYIEMLVAVDYCNNAFALKRPKRTMWLSAFFLYSAGFTVFSLFENIFFNLLVFLFINTALIIICYKSNFKRAVLSSILMTALMSCAEVIFIIGSKVSINGNIIAYGDSLATYAIGSLLSKLTYFILTKIMSRRIIMKNSYRSLQIPVFLFILPVCSILLFYLFWTFSAQIEMSFQLDIIVSVVSIFITLGIISTYFFYSKAQETVDELYIAQSQAEKTKVDIAYYAILDRQNEQLKTILHDEKNHLATIKSLSDSKEINEYIDRLCGEIKISSFFGNTENKMLDLVLNKYSYICENENIILHVFAKTANLNYIENTDLVTIMSNMLDNAVEAARNSQERTIELSINKTNGFDIITCINSCDTEPESLGEVLKTTKKEKGFHGLGVKSIKKIVTRYNGTFEWDYDKNAHEFSVYIAFRN